MNMQQKFVTVLEVYGFVVVEWGEYIVMGNENSRTSNDEQLYFYIAKSGVLRIGSSLLLSYAVVDSDKKMLLAKYEELTLPGF